MVHAGAHSLLTIKRTIGSLTLQTTPQVFPVLSEHTYKVECSGTAADTYCLQRCSCYRASVANNAVDITPTLSPHSWDKLLMLLKSRTKLPLTSVVPECHPSFKRISFLAGKISTLFNSQKLNHKSLFSSHAAAPKLLKLL